ncbi:MAG TPA: FAD-linked oxidase C-terminal domain-containing protein [Gaiellaceae bacterium]|nr:FAD-linked oxidase C-terminal domain-containing protein [Gaiellaceae bacterium]
MVVRPTPGVDARDRRIERGLAALLGRDQVLPGTAAEFLRDATEERGVAGWADAVALPRAADEAAAALAWCYERGVPIVPRGGGTGLAGGAVPQGGVVLSTDRLQAVRSFVPELWRIEVEAGVRTADLRRRARENGLLFPPDPGAAEQSHVGGNIATNAGGPHAFKYGTTGAWVTGLEAVVPPGDLVRVGGVLRKDVAGLDLKRLLIGSEGTLALVTAATLRLIPAPESALPVVAFFPDLERGCEAVGSVLASGLVPAALDYLDEGALRLAGPSYPGRVPDGAGFALLAEADGGEAEAAGVRDGLVDVFAESALAVETTVDRRALWRWRDGVSLAVATARGGKVSEDLEVPVERLADAVRATVEVGRRHGLTGLSWGHAGDGNLHATFLVAPDDGPGHEAADGARAELFAVTRALGGSISGEHGLGLLKREYAEWPAPVAALQGQIKAAFDPRGLLNPGKKLPAGGPGSGSRL